MTPPVAVLAGARVQTKLAMESARVVAGKLRERGHQAWIVRVEEDAWTVEDEGRRAPVDREAFAFTRADGERVRFGFAFVAIHDDIGKGAVQGYLELLGVPHDSSRQFAALLCDDKHATKLWLSEHAVPMAPGLVYRGRAPIAADEIVARLGLPCFVKPKRGGSGIGASKVSALEELAPALAEALRWDDELLIEAFIPGREVTCGVVRLHGELHALPLTEYLLGGGTRTWELNQGTVPKQTPAPLPEALAAEVQAIARRAYEALDCRGLVRIDFRLDAREGDAPRLLEVNTLPGLELRGAMLTQVVAAGLDVAEVFEALLLDSLQEHAGRRRPGTG